MGAMGYAWIILTNKAENHIPKRNIHGQNWPHILVCHNQFKVIR